MQREILPVDNLLFLKIFSSEGNEDVTCGFIDDMIGVKVKDLSYTTPYNFEVIRKQAESDPTMQHTEVDVRVKLSDGTQAIIEMQKSSHDAWDKRALYYSASRYVASLGVHKKGEPSVENYKALRPAYGIYVLDFSSFKDDDYALRTFRLYDDVHERLYGPEPLGLLSLTFFELKKEPKATTINQKFWRMMFQGEKLPDGAPAYIHKAQSSALWVNLSEEEAAMITAHQKAVLDYNSAMDFKWNDGFAQGEAEGEAKRSLEVARRLLSQGVDPTIVATSTDLDLETLNTLLD
jgi:predicted transposase/invertase (TIGR01784 family)